MRYLYLLFITAFLLASCNSVTEKDSFTDNGEFTGFKPGDTNFDRLKEWSDPSAMEYIIQEDTLMASFSTDINLLEQNELFGISYDDASIEALNGRISAGIFTFYGENDVTGRLKDSLVSRFGPADMSRSDQTGISEYEWQGDSQIMKLYGSGAGIKLKIEERKAAENKELIYDQINSLSVKDFPLEDIGGLPVQYVPDRDTGKPLKIAEASFALGMQKMKITAALARFAGIDESVYKGIDYFMSVSADTMRSVGATYDAGLISPGDLRELLISKFGDPHISLKLKRWTEEEFANADHWIYKDAVIQFIPLSDASKLRMNVNLIGEPAEYILR